MKPNRADYNHPNAHLLHVFIAFHLTYESQSEKLYIAQHFYKLLPGSEHAATQ